MILSLIIIIFFGYIFSFLAKMLKLPHILGYILAGVLVGPNVLNGLDQLVMINSGVIKQIALMLILVISGLSIQLEDLKTNKIEMISLSIIPSVLGIISGIFAGFFLLQLELFESVLLGVVICGVAPAIVLPRMLKIIEEKGEYKQIPQIIFSAIILNDILLLFLFPIFLFWINNSNDVLQYSLLIPIIFMLEVVIAYLMTLLVVFIAKKCKIHKNLISFFFLIICIIIVLLEVKISAFLPFSAILLIVIFSIFIRYKSKELADTIIVPFKKIWHLGELLLFTLVGAGLNLGILNQISISHFIALFVIQLFISLGVLIVINFYNYNIFEKKLYILSFSPKGTMQAALGFIPLSLGIVGGEDILIISIISILIFAPFGSILLDRYFINNNSPMSQL